MFSLQHRNLKRERERYEKNTVKENNFTLLVENHEGQVIWHCLPLLLCGCTPAFTKWCEMDSEGKIFSKMIDIISGVKNILLQEGLYFSTKTGSMTNNKQGYYFVIIIITHVAGDQP